MLQNRKSLKVEEELRELEEGRKSYNWKRKKVGMTKEDNFESYK